MLSLVRMLLWALVFWRRYREAQGKDGRTPVFIWLFVVLHLVALLGAVLASGGSPLGVALLVAALALAYPWFLARRVFIALGVWPAAWAFGWLSRLVWPPDGSGAVVAGAWAILRQRRASQRGLDFISGRLRRCSLSPASILAGGLLAAARGDRVQARELFESLEHLDPSRAREAHRCARDFLIADAAEHGDWHRVRQLAARCFPTSAAGRFIGAAASRIIGDAEAPGNAELRALWLAAPRRRLTRELLRRAIASPPPGKNRWPEPIASARARGANALERALSLHVELEGRGAHQIEIDDLGALGRAWDVAFASGELSSVASDRGAELCARAPDRVADQFSSDIERDIAALVRRAGHRFDLLPASSATLARAAAVVREDLLSELELGFTALAARTEDKRALPPIDEWREFLSLRRLHAELARVGGLDVRRVAFPSVHAAACNHAAWLWNDRDEYVLAESMFRWLLAEATIVGDDRAIELQRRNVEA